MVGRRSVAPPRGEPGSPDCHRAADYRFSSGRLRHASGILDRRPRVHSHAVLAHRADTASHVVVRVGGACSCRCREPQRAGGRRAGGAPEDGDRASRERDTVSRARDPDNEASRAYRRPLGSSQHRRRHPRHRRAGADRRRRQRRRSETARTRQRRVRAGTVRDRCAEQPDAGLCRLARRLTGKVLELCDACRRQRICIGSGAAAPRQRRTAWSARIPFQRACEFRRRISGAAHLGRTALHAGPRSGAPLRAGRACPRGSGSREQGEGRVRVDRLARAPHAVERDPWMGVDAAHGVCR